jgi:enoyl-CoA hydratase
MPKYKHILVETPDEYSRVGLVRLNRPKALNALNSELVGELMNALVAFDDDDSIGAIVVTGNDRAFAAGADITEMANASTEEMHKSGHISPFDRIREINKPVIAAVSGWCLGGGNEIAMSCDMIVASETAQFGQPEINLGVIPGAGGTQRLTRAVGKTIAMEVVLNDRKLSAGEALHYGLVNRVVPVELHLAEALNLAAQIGARAPVAIRTAKQAVNQAFETSLSEGVIAERGAFYSLFDTKDQKEGMQAFVEKRQPHWKGE